MQWLSSLITFLTIFFQKDNILGAKKHKFFFFNSILTGDLYFQILVMKRMRLDFVLLHEYVLVRHVQLASGPRGGREWGWGAFESHYICW